MILNLLRRLNSQIYCNGSLAKLASLRCLSVRREARNGMTVSLLAYPKLKHLSDIEKPIYASMKQKDSEKALQLFTALKEQKHKFSSPILSVGFKLMKYYGKPFSWYELCAYMLEVGIAPESGLISLLLEDAISNNATETILDILENCFVNGYRLRSHTFTNSIEYLLLKIKDYHIIDNILDQFLETGLKTSERLFSCLCDAVDSDPSNQKLIGMLKKHLKYFHKKELGIAQSEVFDKIKHTSLTLSSSTAPENPAKIQNGICDQCGQNIRKIHIKEEGYTTLRSEVHKIIQNQYSLYQRTEGMKKDIESFQSAFKNFYNSLQVDNSQGIFIDGMNASFLAKSHRISRLFEFIEVLKQNYHNCKVFIVVRCYVINKFTSKTELSQLATVHTTQHDSRDDLFTVYGALMLKEKGLVLTNDKFSELRNDIPFHLHPLLNSWYTKHVINFNIAFELLFQNQLIQGIQYSDDGSLHIPLLGTENWNCTKLD